MLVSYITVYPLLPDKPNNDEGEEERNEYGDDTEQREPSDTFTLPIVIYSLVRTLWCRRVGGGRKGTGGGDGKHWSYYSSSGNSRMATSGSPRTATSGSPRCNNARNRPPHVQCAPLDRQ